jgi:hypothetical protein
MLDLFIYLFIVNLMMQAEYQTIYHQFIIINKTLTALKSKKVRKSCFYAQLIKHYAMKTYRGVDL